MAGGQAEDGAAAAGGTWPLSEEGWARSAEPRWSPGRGGAASIGRRAVVVVRGALTAAERVCGRAGPVAASEHVTALDFAPQPLLRLW